MSNRVVVRICGEDFPLFTEDSVEYTQSVGSHVNAEMQKCLSAKMGRMNAAIMAALNIADELFKVRETDEQLRVQIKSALDEAARVKAEVNALKRETLSLQKKLEKAEKAQLKAEKSLMKAQKTDAKSAPKGSRDDETPVLLGEAEMAEIVEKSKRPRRTTRKAKAEEASVEVTEVVETPPEVPAEAVEAPEAPAEAVVTEAAAEDAPVAEATEAVEPAAEATEAPAEVAEGVEETKPADVDAQ